ncbi:MAG: type II secretion system protein [Tissierellia bacterium]|nr:type II secretion system protein [Tissierellia bacterium]
MRKAFTLVEVLVAAAIISIVGLSIYNGFGQVSRISSRTHKDYSAGMHILNIQEDLIALNNTNIINPELSYYNLDVVEIFQSLANGSSISKKLEAPEGEYDMAFELLESNENYFRISISIDGEKNIHKKMEVVIYSIKN